MGSVVLAIYAAGFGWWLNEAMGSTDPLTDSRLWALIGAVFWPLIAALLAIAAALDAFARWRASRRKPA